MRKTNYLAALEYESPQVEMVMLEVEHGFAQSSQLDDMKESNGEWANY